MNWDAIGAIGELVGASAVVVSLVYLGIQIRNQRLEEQASLVMSLTQRWTEMMKTIGESPEIIDTWLRSADDYDGLSPAEKIRLSSLLFSFSQVVESLHLMHLKGRVDPQVWESYEIRIREIMSTTGAKKWWESRAHWHTVRFQQFMNEVALAKAPNENYFKPYRNESAT